MSSGRVSCKGFTLIELLVVVAIIALLMSIVMPAIHRAKDYAKRVACGNNLRQIGMAINTFANDHDNELIRNRYVTDDGRIWEGESGYPPHNSYRVYSPDHLRADGSFEPFHLAVLYDLKYIEIPEAFYCPAQPYTTVNYRIPYYFKFYIGEGNATDYYTLSDKGSYEWGTVCPADQRGESSRQVRTSFNYWTYGKKRIDEINGYKPIVFDNIQEWEVVPHRKGRDLDSLPQGLSALYADGHVTFCSDEAIFDDTDNWPWNKAATGDEGSGPGNYIDRFEEVLRRIQGH